MFFKVLSQFNEILGLKSLKKQLFGLKSQKKIGKGIFVRYMGKKEVDQKKVDKKFVGSEVKYCNFRPFFGNIYYIG